VEATCHHYLTSTITDPELRARCTPNYEVGCKRILFSHTWYETLLRDNVKLVASEAVRLDADGVFDEDEHHHRADTIIYGTGFKSQNFVQPIEIIGRDGKNLQSAWTPYPKTYFGVAVSGFPNLFLLYGPNTNLGGNSVLYIEETQVRYIAQAVRYLKESHVASLEIREDRECNFDRWVTHKSSATSYGSGCRSWYVDSQGRNINNWPSLTWNYRRMLGKFNPVDYEVQRVTTIAKGPRSSS
jgi:cation diffusion facilitator CzcD-associated flavoprotein CzcO